jgi:hypothetical protein
MPFTELDDLAVEVRRMSDGNYVVDVIHRRFGNLYEIQVSNIGTGIEIECIDRINDVSVDINTLEDA